MAESISRESYITTGKPGATAASAHAGGTTSGYPSTGVFNTGDFVIDQTGNAWVCVSGNSSGGSWKSVSSSSLATTNGVAKSLIETAYIDTTTISGTYNIYVTTNSSLVLNTTNPTGNFTFNVASTSSVSLNSLLSTGQAITFTVLTTNGSTAYYLTGVSVDGTSQTVNWQGGTAPSAGDASVIDAYVVTIIKTASATYTVLASQTKF